MKGIIGCDADWLQPGDIVGVQDGRRMRIVRKVDLAAAVEIATNLGDTGFKPVDGECFYEIDLDLRAGASEN